MTKAQENVFVFDDEDKIEEELNYYIRKYSFEIKSICEQVFFKKKNLRSYRVVMYGEYNSKNYFEISRDHRVLDFTEKFNLELDNLVSNTTYAFFLEKLDPITNRKSKKHKKHVITYYKK